MALCINVKEEAKNLEYLVLPKIVIRLWKNYCFSVLFETSECSISQWIACEEVVRKDVKKLPLSNTLVEKIQIFVTITGREIFLFMNYLKWTFRDRYYMNTPTILKLLFTKLCWTVNGVIDRTETFKLFLEDESIKPLYRYMISTTFCFQDYFILFDELRQNEKYRCFMVKTDENHGWLIKDLLYEFSKYMLEGVNMSYLEFLGENSEELLRYWLFKSVNSLNKYAFEYFLSKLPDTLRNDLLIDSIVELADTFNDVISSNAIRDRKFDRFIGEYGHFTKMILFLSKKINDDILEVLQDYGFAFDYILISLLNWPYHDQLISTLHLMKNFLQEEHFLSLLNHIIYIIDYEYDDYDYMSLFSNVLEITLQTGIVLQKSDLLAFMVRLSSCIDEKWISFINYMTFSECEKLINNNRCITNCILSDLNQKYLRELIDKCLPELEQLKNYKENCILAYENNTDNYEIFDVLCYEDLNFFNS